MPTTNRAPLKFQPIIEHLEPLSPVSFVHHLALFVVGCEMAVFESTQERGDVFWREVLGRSLAALDLLF